MRSLQRLSCHRQKVGRYEVQLGRVVGAGRQQGEDAAISVSQRSKQSCVFTPVKILFDALAIRFRVEIIAHAAESVHVITEVAKSDFA
jgi:hypothetical protein